MVKVLVEKDSTGVLAGNGEWTASWIWCEGEARPRNFYLYARKTFKLPSRPTRATIRITADSRYKLFINGSYVGRGPVPSDPHRQSYDTYDIAGHLTRGDNVIAVLVHHFGQGTYSYMPGRAAFIAEAEIEWEKGSVKIVTDDTWHVLPAPPWTQEGARMSRRLGFQEVYDARLEPEGWTSTRFRDHKWSQARVLGRPPMQPFDRLLPRQARLPSERIAIPTAVVSIHDAPDLPDDVGPPEVPRFMAGEKLMPLQAGRVDRAERLLSEKEDAATVKAGEHGGVSIILDFGREVFGSVEISVAQANGGMIDIGYSEILENGRVRPDRGDIRYSDRLILRSGKQKWCSFEPRAFRYMQLDFRNCPKPVSISRVVVRETRYPVERRGSFESSDPLLNNIWKIGAETAHICMQDTYIDSPWRERAQWWDSAAIAARTAQYAFGDLALLAQGIRHIADSQRKNGAVLALYPSGRLELFPDFSALWVMSVWEYYAASGDRLLLAEVYPAVVRWLRWIGRFIDKDGLVSRVEGHLFIDWAEIDRRGEVAAMNCLYLGALRAASNMAETLSKGRDAEEWTDTASSLKIAVDKHFWSNDRGLYADARVDGKLQSHYSRQTNVLAALFDVPDHYKKSSIFRQLLEEDGLPQITTPRFISLLVDALCRNGQQAQALDLIRNKWGKMASSGATTFWEYFTPTECLCYGSSAGPTYQLQAYYLGVIPTGEVARVRIQPHPADLRWAKGKVPTAWGDVALEWRVSRNGFNMTFDVPDGMTAEVIPPRNVVFSRVLIDGNETKDSNIEVGSGSHKLQVLAQRSRPTQAGKPEPETEEQAPSTPVPPGRKDIEYVELMIQILSDLEKEHGPRQEDATAEAKPEEKRRRLRRRPRRSRPAAAQAESTPVENSEQTQEQPAEQQETAKPRRRKRTSARAAKSPDANGDQKPAQAEPSPHEEQAAAEPSKRRAGRYRRPKAKPKAEAPPTDAPAKDMQQPAEPKTSAEVEGSNNGSTEDGRPAAEGNNKRPRKHSRRRASRSAETVEAAALDG